MGNKNTIELTTSSPFNFDYQMDSSMIRNVSLNEDLNFLSTTEISQTRIETTTYPSDQMDGLGLSVAYTASEATVSFLAIVGNLLVVYVFCTNRGLRRYRNYYIVGLAVADFLVGLLGIPLAVLASVGLPTNLYGCLFSLSILMVLCTISILCLVAVSIDRYWATTNPFAYYRNMTTSTSVGIILSCWFAGAVIGFLPLFGWHNDKSWNDTKKCYFVKVMDYNYLVFLYFCTIVFPALLMACFYGYIYHIVLIKIRQKGTLAPEGGRRQSEASRSGSLNSDLRGSSQMMRMMVSEKRREAKAAKKLSIIVLFFMICWMPLYTINCIQAFCQHCNVPQELLNFTIILSHANSALNPFLYAYHLKEFRLAMKIALCTCFSRLSCGCIEVPIQKDNYPGMSRSQTMPSIANHTLSTQQTSSGGKLSTKFRKVSAPTGNIINNRQNHHHYTRRAPYSIAASRDNLLHPIESDKSITSLSPQSESTINNFSPIISSPDGLIEENEQLQLSSLPMSRSISPIKKNDHTNTTCETHGVFEAEIEPHHVSPTNNEHDVNPKNHVTILHWEPSSSVA